MCTEIFRLDLLLTAIGFPPGGSVQYTSTKTQTLHKETIKQTYNIITRNRKNKKQPYRTKKQTEDGRRNK
jgi:hypothetical protein